MVSIIAVIGKNRELGLNNKLLWNIPDDMRHFRKITMGHPMIMGRKTFDSVGKILPGRTNIIISRKNNFEITGGLVLNSFEDALGFAKNQDGGEEIFIIGGGEIYRQAILIADKLYLTLVDDAPQADVFFPEHRAFNNIVSEEKREYNGIRYKFLELIKSNDRK